jgi:hypothetical protein
MMITLEDVTCSSATSYELCQKLRAFGVARVPNFLTPVETRLVFEEAKVATSTLANYLNPYGPCSRFTLQQLPPHLARSRDLIEGNTLQQLPSQFRYSRQVIESDVFRQTTVSYLGPGSGFMEVVAFTRDCTPDLTAVYGKLHFDRRHQLKFILYLNDVDQSNGAFGCIPGSHKRGQRLFRSRWRQVLGLRTNSDSEVEEAAAATPEDQPEYHLVPCVMERMNSTGHVVPKKKSRLNVDGSAGTLVAFDSHLLHYGGFVTRPHKERWTLKGHTFARLPSDVFLKYS